MPNLSTRRRSKDLVSHWLVWAVFLALLAGCGHQQPVIRLQFPEGENYPFLSLEKVYTGNIEAAGNWTSKIKILLAGDCPKISLQRPAAVAIDSLDRVYVVDAELGRVLRFKGSRADCNEVTDFGSEVLKVPTGIAVSPDAIFVSDTGRHLVQVFDYNLNPVRTIERAEFVRPGQIKYDPVTQRLLVVDPPAHKVFIFHPAGEFIAALGGLGTAPTQFHFPVAVGTDSSGRIFVLDGLNRKVKRFSPELAFLSSFGVYDRTPGSFGFPKGLAISSDGFVFVSDAAFGNIQIFSQQGALLYFFGQTGWQPGEFLLPTALRFDRQDRLYVVDQYNNRIQVFQYYAQP